MEKTPGVRDEAAVIVSDQKCLRIQSAEGRNVFTHSYMLHMHTQRYVCTHTHRESTDWENGRRGLRAGIALLVDMIYKVLM